jgi:hypothetical protein
MKYCRKTPWLGVIVFLIFAGSAYGTPLTTDYKPVTITFAAGSPTTSGVYDPTDPYVIGGERWVANLIPQNAMYLTGVPANFANVLAAAFPTTAGWSYQSSATELSDNSLVIHTYDVQGTPARVGAEFHVEYVSHGTDPTSDIHWIQVVTNNHSITGVHGDPANVVDNPFSPAHRSPYYDDGGAATGTQFYDFPGRNDANNSHTWQAVLFLVTGPAANVGPGLITFWGGIEWGWENHRVPEPSALLLLGAGLAGLVGYRRKFKRSYTIIDKKRDS